MEFLRSHILFQCKQLSNHRLVCPAQEGIEISLAGRGLGHMGWGSGRRNFYPGRDIGLVLSMVSTCVLITGDE